MDQDSHDHLRIFESSSVEKVLYADDDKVFKILKHTCSIIANFLMFFVILPTGERWVGDRNCNGFIVLF